MDRGLPAKYTACRPITSCVFFSQLTWSPARTSLGAQLNSNDFECSSLSESRLPLFPSSRSSESQIHPLFSTAPVPVRGEKKNQLKLNTMPSFHFPTLQPNRISRYQETPHILTHTHTHTHAYTSSLALLSFCLVFSPCVCKCILLTLLPLVKMKSCWFEWGDTKTTLS